jgi:hypothetical protein
MHLGEWVCHQILQPHACLVTFAHFIYQIVMFILQNFQSLLSPASQSQKVLMVTLRRYCVHSTLVPAIVPKFCFPHSEEMEWVCNQILQPHACLVNFAHFIYQIVMFILQNFQFLLSPASQSQKVLMVTLRRYRVHSILVPAIVPKFCFLHSEEIHVKKELLLSNGRGCAGKRGKRGT